MQIPVSDHAQVVKDAIGIARQDGIAAESTWLKNPRKTPV